MEFWGVEVKPGEPLKVQPEFGKLIHISQAALGEVKDVKGAKYVPLRLKIDDKSLVLGALSAAERTQLMFDLVFEREFELSHDWKTGSVYFMGYTAEDPVSDEEDFSDEFEDEPMDALLTGNIKQNLGDVKDAKTAATTEAGNKKEGLSVSDEDEDDSESDPDDEIAFIKSAQEDFSDDSEKDSEDDMDGSFSSEEEEPPKAQQTKKRPADSAQKAPVLNKKAKPSTSNNTGNKTAHNAIPLPSKKPGKGPAANKPNGKNKKSNGRMSRK
ncbi:histone deacetylase HDT1-like isoform X2 [Primulina huaijiensis]|uniref:histone deacetylase HDT1-like isoform X2 n=1 Tax=Primulina huaijiensis TaxID=1492673 RepID=UPI003CC72FD4